METKKYLRKNKCEGEKRTDAFQALFYSFKVVVDD